MKPMVPYFLSKISVCIVPADAKEVVLTEGEYDAMAVYQATGRPSISLPNGCRSLPDQVLPLLERFEKIYLWMDNDGPGREGAEHFSKKLGLNRCYLVQPMSIDGKPAPKDANEALLAKLDLEKMIQDARLTPHGGILTFSSIRMQVLEEIMNPNKFTGLQLPSLPILNGIIKGFRRGEMTVLTGPTGSGKTTFLGQLSLDFAEQGHSVLWGSFEIKNTRLIHKLLQQYAREPLIVDAADSVASLNAVADRFENLPLYFMKFHGGSDVDDVLDAMDYAAYVHDVEHIILDNLQFMISRNQARSSFDKFDYQDMAIEKFRKFATEKNVHVTVVVHPRKEDEYSRLGISSIFGSAKATQEADSVLILQYDGQRKYIEVKKNRYDGSLGHCELHFQRKSCRYSDQPDPGKTLVVPSQNMLNNSKRLVTGVGTQSIKDRAAAYNMHSQMLR
jgi:twinkle protein